MGKNTFFIGNPIFSQVLSLIPKELVAGVVTTFCSNHYTKKFDTYSHLITMLFVAFKNCTSLREVEIGMSVCHSKLQHLGLSYIPPRSTLAEANAKRDSKVFSTIYYKLYHKLKSFLPDSQTSKKDKNLYIIDSSTVSLFQEIMGACAGRKPIDGKRKGGLKVHTLMKVDEDVPQFVRIGKGASSDSKFLKTIKLRSNSILVFDKAYVDYVEYNRFADEKVWIVTRIKESAVFTVEGTRELTEYHKKMGVISDTDVTLGHHHHDKANKVRGRIVCYIDKLTGKLFKFFTTNLKFSPLTIAQIYKKRWQIEILFKRIKQNYPLRYFLGDNENAIKIQVWCSLMADLLLKVIKAGIKRKWSFTGLASIVRHHLLEYINLTHYLEHPERVLKNYRAKIKESPPTLFSSLNFEGGLRLQF